MNKYLVEIYHYFSGYKTFIIEALNKKDAITKARAYIEHNIIYSDGNYDTNRIRCIKKIRK